MADDPKNRGKRDRVRVSGKQAHETSYTSRKTGTSPGEVRKAVKEVGSSRSKVESRLKGKRKS